MMDENSLRKKVNALTTYVAALQRKAEFWKEAHRSLNNEMLLSGKEAIDAEREMNKILSNALERAENNNCKYKARMQVLWDIIHGRAPLDEEPFTWFDRDGVPKP